MNEESIIPEKLTNRFVSELNDYLGDGVSVISYNEFESFIESNHLKAELSNAESPIKNFRLKELFNRRLGECGYYESVNEVISNLYEYIKLPIITDIDFIESDNCQGTYDYNHQVQVVKILRRNLLFASRIDGDIFVTTNNASHDNIKDISDFIKKSIIKKYGNLGYLSLPAVSCPDYTSKKIGKNSYQSIEIKLLDYTILGSLSGVDGEPSYCVFMDGSPFNCTQVFKVGNILYQPTPFGVAIFKDCEKKDMDIVDKVYKIYGRE